MNVVITERVGAHSVRPQPPPHPGGRTLCAPTRIFIIHRLLISCVYRGNYCASLSIRERNPHNIFFACRILPVSCVYKAKGLMPVTNKSPQQTEDIVTQYQDKLLRTAIAIMGNKADAEDIVQETFIKLFQKNPDFQSEQHETAWLIRVTVNLCKSRLRSHWWKKTEPLLESYPTQSDNQQNLMETVLSLPAKYRIVIHLFYYEGYRTKEIAKITELSESTVRQQLTRARRMLKDYLEGEQV